MSQHETDAAADVLIVSEHEEFATAASRQLAADDCAVQTQSLEEASRTSRSQECSPAVALVDCDARAPDGSLLRHTLCTTLPGCQIIVICTPDQAASGAHLARSGQVWDYVLTDSVRDPNRLSLLVERARGELCPAGDRREASVGDAAAQYQQVLQALAEMRELLKEGIKNPIAKLLSGLKFDTSSNRLGGELLEEAAAGYEDCLPEFIAGRLRRLENQILLWGHERIRVPTDFTSSRILVVEDDTISAELAKHILERHGFDVVLAKTAVAAKEALSRHPPDLVLMDIHLGDANGLELIKRLRAGTVCPDVPVIVTTSDRMRDTLFDAVDVNVQAYLLKPYQPSLLVQKVKTVLATSQEQNRVAEASFGKTV